MKIQLDTDKKTIKLESNVKISKLLDTLKKLLPNGEYREFTLETNTTIQTWTSPIVIHDHHDHYPRPYIGPWYYSKPNYINILSANKQGNIGTAFNVGGNLTAKSNAVETMQLKSGVFNVEV